jgi:SNF2 family DNA or RNA helicase
MGLGKTIMTISMLAHLACKEGIWGPHLIIVPSSVLLNWEMELKRFCPAFKILTYFGSQKQRRQKRQGWTKPNSFHVCLTSYKLAIQDQHTFKRKKWFYMILDEAHNIKNYQSQRWQTLLNYRSKRRLLLTGTPLQNDLMELWSLMHFLMPHVFQSHKEFKEWFSKPVTSMVEGTTAQNDQLVQRLHSILRPFMLRRLKKDVEKQMPGKFEHVVYCKLSKRQRFLYDEYMSSTNTQATLRGGTYLGIANVLMQLRKVCNHPDLFESRPIVSPFDQGKITYTVPSLAMRALDYDPHKNVSLSFFNLQNLPALSRRQTHLSVIESRSLKPSIEEIRFAASQGSYRPTIAPPPQRQTLVRSGGRLPAPQPVSRNVTRVSNVLRPAIRIPRDVFFDPYLNEQLGVSEANAAGAQQPHGNLPPPTLSSPRERRAPKPMGGQLTRSNYFDTLKQQQRQRLLQEATARADQLVYINEIRHERVPFIGYDTIRVCKMDHPVFDIGRIANDPRRIEEYPRPLADAVVPFEQRAEELKDTVAHFACIIPAVRAAAVELHASHPSPSVLNRKRLDVLKLKQRVALPEKTQILHNAQMRLSVYFPDKRLVQFDCGKLQQLDLLLRELKRGGHRALIFTQMTRMLDVLEQFLNIHGHTYLRLDGAVKVEQRQKMMERFNNDRKVFLFILTTRTGGIGINLTGADTVIFYDSDWNPAMDAQAQDRCHRIGQTREVHIYRLISEHTIEENILKKARQKLQLDQIIKDGKFTTEFFHRVDIRDFISDARKTLENGPAAIAAAEEEGLPAMSDKDLEQALLDAEDETDRIALRQVRAEQAQETEEFNENAANPLASSTGAAGGEIDDPVLMALSSVQRYAVRFVEEVNPVVDKDELELQHRQVEADEQVWQQDALKRIQEGQESSDDEGVIVSVPSAMASPVTPRRMKSPVPASPINTPTVNFTEETPRVAAAAFAEPALPAPASPAPAGADSLSPAVSPRSSRRKPGRPPKSKRGTRGAAAGASAVAPKTDDDDDEQLFYEGV